MTTPTPHTTTGAVERLRTALAKGGAHIGDLAWPELRLAGQNLEREQLRAWLLEEALPEDWAPEDPSGQKAFGKALSLVKNLESAPNVSIERESLRSRVALVRHHIGKGLEKKTSTWARLWVNDLDEIETEWSQEKEIKDALDGTMSSTVMAHVQHAISTLHTEYARLMDYTDAAEVGEMVVHVVCEKLGGIRIRRDGGLYYVPSLHGEELRSFARVIGRMGTSALPFLPAFDTPEGRTNLGRAIHETLTGEINAVVKGLALLGGESVGPRQSSLHRRLEELKELSARAETCKALLEGQMENIELAVQGARDKVLEMLKEG